MALRQAQIICYHFKIACPHCGEDVEKEIEEDIWTIEDVRRLQNPRQTCDHCDKEFNIVQHKNAVIME